MCRVKNVLFDLHILDTIHIVSTCSIFYIQIQCDANAESGIIVMTLTNTNVQSVYGQ